MRTIKRGKINGKSCFVAEYGPVYPRLKDVLAELEQLQAQIGPEADTQSGVGTTGATAQMVPVGMYRHLYKGTGCFPLTDEPQDLERLQYCADQLMTHFETEIDPLDFQVLSERPVGDPYSLCIFDLESQSDPDDPVVLFADTDPDTQWAVVALKVYAEQIGALITTLRDLV